MKKKRIYLCSYPKSGRTWVRFIISNYINDLFNLGLNVDFQSMFKITPNLINNKTRGIEAYKYYENPQIPFIVSTHNTNIYAPNRQIILILRKPHDILVSYFHHLKFHTKNFNGSFTQFLNHPEFGIKKLIDYLNYWDPFVNKILIITYEQMHKNCHGEISKIIKFINLKIDTKTLNEDINKSSFASMKKIEIRNKVPGEKYNANNKKERRVRAGVIDGYKQFMNKNSIDIVNKQLPNLKPNIRPKLGIYF
ncbi:MAG: sulfotransferase domain-containing protein [Atribacterota bacterium]